jgi:hypothetical protein
VNWELPHTPNGAITAGYRRLCCIGYHVVLQRISDPLICLPIRVIFDDIDGDLTQPGRSATLPTAPLPPAVRLPVAGSPQG